MSLENKAITITNDLPIKHEGTVHDGKVRSVYWLTQDDSNRLSAGWGLGIQGNQKGLMVISDRISAFDCGWQSESGLKGIPGKGASLNAISKYWFELFETVNLGSNHVLASPHPLVWIVERAEPIMIEAIARQYITGSMWRDYSEKGVREFGGLIMPDGLKKDQRLEQVLITPSTKGIIKGIEGIPEQDDVNITRQHVIDNYKLFGFKCIDDVTVYEKMLKTGFELISANLEKIGKVFVDTKFEFGYVPNEDEGSFMIYMDEVGTPDSSRYWDKEKYENGKTVEESKEAFRQALLDSVPDRDVLLNKNRMEERKELARTFRVPDKVFMETSDLYKTLAEHITGRPIPIIDNPRQEIIEALIPYGIIR
ncbi:MAG: phosphoribosylaminoimidazolesuccinocarboxamide synthase [Candidatus Woesearchaeota archaeon]